MTRSRRCGPQGATTSPQCPFRIICTDFGLTADVRLGGASSTGRCNTGVKSLCWRLELQGLPWPFVELSHYPPSPDHDDMKGLRTGQRPQAQPNSTGTADSSVERGTPAGRHVCLWHKCEVPTGVQKCLLFGVDQTYHRQVLNDANDPEPTSGFDKEGYARFSLFPRFLGLTGGSDWLRGSAIISIRIPHGNVALVFRHACAWRRHSAEPHHASTVPRRLSRRPGRAPVCSPPSITTVPLTITVPIPAGYWCGSS
jgi:hypothetical protein